MEACLGVDPKHVPPARYPFRGGGAPGGGPRAGDKLAPGRFAQGLGPFQTLCVAQRVPDGMDPLFPNIVDMLGFEE